MSSSAAGLGGGGGVAGGAAAGGGCGGRGGARPRCGGRGGGGRRAAAARRRGLAAGAAASASDGGGAAVFGCAATEPAASIAGDQQGNFSDSIRHRAPLVVPRVTEYQNWAIERHDGSDLPRARRRRRVRARDRRRARARRGERDRGVPGRLLAGDRAAIAAAFAGAPSIDDPFAGAVRGAAALDAFVAERHAWLAARAARLSPGPITRAAGRTVVEAVLHLHHEGRDVDLPIAVVGDDAPDGRLRALRVYHSASGRSRATTASARRCCGAIRPRTSTGAVAEYQRALAAGDVDAIVATFEADGYFREPSGEPWVHRGPAELRKFMTQILGAGGIGIDHATVTDDGKTCAIEFNAVRFGKHALTPRPASRSTNAARPAASTPPASTTTSTSRCSRRSESLLVRCSL